jgi:hypothetical protein
MDKEPLANQERGQFTPLSSPVPINFWQERMASIWISPGADIGHYMEAIFVNTADISFLKSPFINWV